MATNKEYDIGYGTCDPYSNPEHCIRFLGLPFKPLIVKICNFVNVFF
jgi:hypothetical protein